MVMFGLIFLILKFLIRSQSDALYECFLFIATEDVEGMVYVCDAKR